ncbi:MAG: hypothetical protein WBI29_02625 [Candidatus Saccharimonadales bacterium]
MNKKIIISIVLLILLATTFAGLTKTGAIPNFLNIEFLCPESNESTHYYEDNSFDSEDVIIMKPVIYLYPTEKQDTTVKLDYDGDIIVSYPDYDETINGWRVTANPDGTIINNKDGLTYSYLFWEGKETVPTQWNFDKGFVVNGSDTISFLQNKLSEIGLTPREYNEFIVYWYPMMKDNKYNLITFVGKEYTDKAPLNISPSPDSMLRVFMVYKKIEEEISIEPQIFQKFDRNGFTVIEWGGARL